MLSLCYNEVIIIKTNTMTRKKRVIKVMMFDSEGKDVIRVYDESFFKILGEEEVGMEVKALFDALNDKELPF